jgi:hypothetical protein
LTAAVTFTLLQSSTAAVMLSALSIPDSCCHAFTLLSLRFKP